MREGAAWTTAWGIQHNGVNSQEFSSALTKWLGVNERRTAECHAYFSDENEKKMQLYQTFKD